MPYFYPAADPYAAFSQLLLVMESLALPRRPGPAPPAAAALADGLKSPKPVMKKQAVKRHHHKHNLRHRYEFLETLGKGTYGKVKKARESSGRLVSAAPSAAPAGGRLGLGRGLEPRSGEWPPSFILDLAEIAGTGGGGLCRRRVCPWLHGQWSWT